MLSFYQLGKAWSVAERNEWYKEGGRQHFGGISKPSNFVSFSRDIESPPLTWLWTNAPIWSSFITRDATCPGQPEIYCSRGILLCLTYCQQMFAISVVKFIIGGDETPWLLRFRSLVLSYAVKLKYEWVLAYNDILNDFLLELIDFIRFERLSVSSIRLHEWFTST